jgi:hypothetical protein
MSSNPSQWSPDVDYDALAGASRAAQGLPPKVTDPAALARAGALLRQSKVTQPKATKTTKVRDEGTATPTAADVCRASPVDVPGSALAAWLGRAA